MGKYTDAKVGALSVSQVIVLIGTIIGLIAVFCTWFDCTKTVLMFDVNYKYTGWDFAFNNDVKNISDDSARWMPFVAWIFALLTFVMSFMPLIKSSKVSYKTWGALWFFGGVLMLIFACVWGNWKFIFDETCFTHAMAGCWLMIVASIIVIIGGLLPFADKE